ncbi:MAG: hypothetical protein ACKOTF_05350 [Opitutaceae bacterium]
MRPSLIDIIASENPAIRDTALERWGEGRTLEELLAACRELDAYRRRETNLYRRVRALFFIAASQRDHLPAQPGLARAGRVPHNGFRHLLERRFEEAISVFLRAQEQSGPSETLASAWCAGRCAPPAATPGCSVWDIRRTSRCACGASCSPPRKNPRPFRCCGN